MSEIPGVKRRHDHDESENEDGDQDSDSDQSLDDDSSSSDASVSDDSSAELDEEECEKRRGIYYGDLTDLERQFSLLREQLYRERITQVEAKLEEVKLGQAPEYLLPLEELQEAMRIRLEVACILRKFRLENINNKHEAEVTASRQNFENEKVTLWDIVEGELEEKIRRLEEDRNNVDVTSEVWVEQNLQRKFKRHRQSSMSSTGRRKPVTVSGPYIVYMLREHDILDDWTVIKKALTASKRKAKFGKLGSPRHYVDVYA